MEVSGWSSNKTETFSHNTGGKGVKNSGIDFKLLNPASLNYLKSLSRKSQQGRLGNGVIVAPARLPSLEKASLEKEDRSSAWGKSRKSVVV